MSSNVIRRVFDSKAVPILMAGFAVLLIAGLRRPLRRQKMPIIQRLRVNTILAGPSFGLLRLVFLPAMVKLAAKNRHPRIGTNHWFSQAIRTAFVFLVLDYGNYLWHLLNHKIPLLWRFHLVHHTDLDLDTVTAIRFHFGEIVGSILFRGLFVWLSSAAAEDVLWYELLFEGATQFHHSNLEIPAAIEQNLNRVIVTPRMHGIHHSMKKEETDSNYSVIFSFWDRLHRTFRRPGNEQPFIGVPAYSDAREMTAPFLLLLPFAPIRPWQSAKQERGNSL